MALSKEKLQKLELSMTGSTKAPPTLDEMGEDEEDRASNVSGSAITSTYRSGSRAQSARNAKSQAKNLRRAFVYQGLMTKETADRMSVEAVLAYRVAHHAERAETSMLTEERLEVLRNQKQSMLTEMVSFKGWLQSEMSQDITAEEKRAFQKKWLLKKDYGGQEFLCRLCGKETWGGPGCQHLKSTQHVEKETEEILLDRLFGRSAGRRLGEGCHIPTREAVRAYWGQNVENLITILEAKIQAGEEIRFRYGKSAKSASHVISNKSRYRFHLAIIKYSETTGNYHNNTYSCNDVRLWNLLPEVEDEETRRRYEKNQKSGDKWWPVIMCQVDGEPDGPYEGIVADYVYVIICFYQSLEKLMNAWCAAFQEMQEDQPDSLCSRDAREALASSLIDALQYPNIDAYHRWEQ